MKTKIIFPFACSLLLLLTSNVLLSQAPAKKSDFKNTVAMAVAPERAITNSNDVPLKINDKIQRSFAGAFAGVTGENWSMAGQDFHCSFFVNGVPASVLFTKKGNQIYFITYGKETNMPSDIRKIVKTTYFDYTILSAVEVKQDKRDIWVVSMKQDYNNLVVRIENGEMEVVKDFTTPDGI